MPDLLLRVLAFDFMLRVVAGVALALVVLALPVGLVYLLKKRAQLQAEVDRHQATRTELDSFFDLSIDLLCLATPDGYFKRINPAFQKVLGYDEQELLARPFLNFVHEDDRPATVAELEKLAAGHPTIHFENRYRCDDGGYKWLAWRAQPFGEVIYAVAREVTQEKQRAEILEQQTLLLKRGEEMARVGHWRVDLLAGQVTWSDEVYRIHGRDPETFRPTLEKGINAYHPDDRERVSTCVQRAIEEGERFEFELRIVRPTGEIRHVVSRGECAVGAGGQVEALFGVFMDITERKRAEEALRHSEHILNEAQALAEVGHYEWNLETGRFLWSDQFYRLLGEAPQAFPPSVQRFLSYVYPDDREMVAGTVEHFRRTGEFLPMAYRVHRRDGSERWFYSQAFLEREEDGAVCRVLGVVQDVTEREEAEAALRRSEARYRHLYNGTPVMLHSINDRGELVSVSDYWLEKMGYEREEVLGRRSTDFLSDESRQRAPEILQEFYRTGYSFDTPYQFVKKSGDVMDVLLSAISERDEDGRVIRSLAVIVDITERKRAEEALRQNENRFRLLHRITTQAARPFDEQIQQVLRLTTELFELDVGLLSRIDGDTYTVMACSSDVLAPGQTFALGQTYCSLTYAADDIVAIEHMAESPHHRHPCYGAFGLEAYIGIPLVVRGQRYGTLNFSGAVPREGRFGEGAREFVRLLAQWVAALLARQQGDEALRQSEERYRLLFETAPEAIAIQNAERVLAANAACARLLAAETPDDIVGRDPYSLILPEYHAIVEREAAAMLASGKPSPRVALRYRRFDGEVIDVEVVATAIQWEGQTAMQILIADVTERNRARRALERSNRELEQFAYVASHDLQEPLRTISNYVRLLQRRYHGQLDADADDFIEFVVDGAGRMQALIQDLLSYSRAGRQEIRRVPVALGDVLRQTLVGMQGLVEETGARITHGPLPTVRADATQMMLLLQNLISNGVKFRGEAVPEVHITAERVPEGWRVAVSDNGIGIPPEHGERIFEVFKRLQSRRTYKGTGVGLAICKKIVERHDGTIWVQSEQGHGATFYVTLPATEPETAPDARPRPARRGQPERHPAHAGGL